MKINYIRFVVLTFLALLLSYPDAFAARQNERILLFKSDVTVHRDRSMTVTETIKVVCAGEKIKRGIYRFFPTTYTNRWGNNVRVLFKVIEVLKDGVREPFHIEKGAGGMKLYIGSKDVFLPPGEYTYQITYQTDRQLGFFDDFDELYWNVTGNNWDFVIERAEVVVQLPPGTPILKKTAYTGFKGMQGRNFIVSKDDRGNVIYTTARPLQPGEGLTIAVSFPKGIILEPVFRDKVRLVFRDYPGTIVAMIGLLMLLAYYLAVWLKVGRDPEKGTIVPQFKPPKGFSPAAARYVLRMGYSNKVFAAAIVNMAVKGYLQIVEDKGRFTLIKTKVGKAVLSKGEHKIINKLFTLSDSFEFETKNATKIQNAIKALKTTLKLEFEKIYFNRNFPYLIPGFVLTLLTLIAMSLMSPVGPGAIIVTLWLSIWTVACYFLTASVLKGWKAAVALREGAGLVKKGGAVMATLFVLPFLAFEFIGLALFSMMVSPMAVVIFLLIILLNVLFYQLLKAPTIYGRKIMDHLEGFKMYLEIAEEERYNFLHPPEKTPQLFEKYFPYALALGVENAWCDKFAAVLTEASETQGYSPQWYRGRHWNDMGAIGLASSLGSSFSSAISSSATPPGSSSGSGGGGFSGGGGGGGGGGGW